MKSAFNFEILCLLVCCLSYEYALGALPEKKSKNNSDTLEFTIEEIDTIHTWASPLWGHHLPKLGITKNGIQYVAKYSGSYPNSDIDIMERNSENIWKTKRHFINAYQPSILLVDSEDRMNVIQNSQTAPMMHFRTHSTIGLFEVDTIAKGNGLPDGRGWYVGAGISKNRIFMSYVTLSYDLFLTWKNIGDSTWNTPIVIHRGSIDPVIGNHSWTRPTFDFYGDHGYFVVNETSDGSVKNTYNAVVLVTFLLSDPSQFKTEYIDKVHQGYTAFNTDFSISPGGMLVCTYNKGGQIYNAGKNNKPSEPGTYVAIRKHSQKKWDIQRVLDSPNEGCVLYGNNNSICVFQIHAKRDSISNNLPDNLVNVYWSAAITYDNGNHWEDVVVKGSGLEYTNPSHLQLSKANTFSLNRTFGLFEDLLSTNEESKMRFYRLYTFCAKLQ